MHLLFLTDNFPPEVNAPASRTFEHCRLWVKAGIRVTVITCAPNFPKGQVFGGYRNKLWHAEEMEGIRVIRVWSYITSNEGFVKRILDYISFMPSAIIASLGVRNVDLVAGTSPQFFTACAAYAVGALKRIPYVFELRDIWPESIKAVGAMSNSRVIGLLEKIEMFLYRKAAKIVSVTRSFKAILIKRGIDGDKIDVVTNGVDVSRFQHQPKDPDLATSLGLDGKFVLGYVGTHGMAHGLETILETARLCQANADPFHFILLGEGARKSHLKELASTLELKNVLFIDSVSKAEVPRYWSLLDASIIHLRKTDLFTSVIPSKLFECMAMGIPVLHGVEGESAEIVRSEDVGLTFTPEDSQELYRCIRRIHEDRSLYQHYRSKCLQAALHYDRATLAAQMLEIMKTLVSRH